MEALKNEADAAASEAAVVKGQAGGATDVQMDEVDDQDIAEGGSDVSIPGGSQETTEVEAAEEADDEAYDEAMDGSIDVDGQGWEGVDLH